MKTSSVRRFLAVGILSGLGVLLGVGTLLGEGTLSGVKDLSGEPPARAQAAEDTAWFELEGDLAAVWQLTPGQAANTLRIVPRPTSAAEAELGAEALVVFAKRSSAYGIAMNRILKVFGRRKIQISWTLSNSEGELSNATRELRAVERGHYDLVFAMGSDATAWLHQRLEGSATPVVSVCSKDPVLMGLIEDYEGGSGSNFAFTSLNVPVDVQLAYLRTLRPSLSQIALVYTRSNTSTVLTQVDPMVERAEAEGIEIHRVEVLDQDLAREELDWKVQRAVYRMRRQDPDGESSVFWITGSTSVFQEMSTINRHAGNIPVLAVISNLVTPGDDSALLSIGTSFESNAHQAAIYGIRILQGSADPGALDVGVVLPPDISISFRKARQIGAKIPFEFFESASVIYDAEGRLVRQKGKLVSSVHSPALSTLR